MIKLYLVRHGETEANKAHILQGHLPYRLSESGRMQAVKLRNELKGIHFDAVITSDLIRSVETAQILVGNRSIIQTKLLREKDWGDFAGHDATTLEGLPTPNNVESMEEMLVRAQRFINFLREHYDGQTILAVGHGIINKAILSVLLKEDPKEIPVMQNAECRILQLL